MDTEEMRRIRRYVHPLASDLANPELTVSVEGQAEIRTPSSAYYSYWT